MIRFKPVNDYILIEKAAKPSKIRLPDTSEPVSDDIFEVMDVGPGTDDYPQTLKIGDLVCLTGYINTFSFEGTKAILGRARDVLAVVTREG